MLMKKIIFKREVTYLILYAINFCGVFPYSEQVPNAFLRYSWFIYSALATSYMCGTSLFEMLIKDYGFLTNVSIIISIISTLICFVAPAICLYLRKKLIQIMELVDSGFFAYEGEDKFEVEHYTVEKILRKEAVFTVSIFWVYIPMTIAPLIFALTAKRDVEKNPMDLVYVAWTPFGIDSNRQFILSFMLQELSTVCMYVSYMSKALFVKNVGIEFEDQCNKLRYALRTLEDRVSKRAVLESDDESTPFGEKELNRFVICDEDEYVRKLTECVAHYQELQKLLRYFNEWFSLIYSCELAYGILSFALIGYVVIGGTGNRTTDVKYICLLGLFGGLVCFECIQGETIYGIEDQVHEEIYNLSWYNQSAKVRKSVQMFLNEAQPKRKLRGLKIYPASIITFASMVRISYSYLNLLNKTMRNL